jgi:hypothetical protein
MPYVFQARGVSPQSGGQPWLVVMAWQVPSGCLNHAGLRRLAVDRAAFGTCSAVTTRMMVVPRVSSRCLNPAGLRCLFVELARLGTLVATT